LTTRLLFFALLCFTIPILGIAQQDAKVDPVIITPLPALTEVAIGIPNLKPEEFHSVKANLNSVKGVIWHGYCEDQHYVFLYVDRSIQKDDKVITDVILEANRSLKLYFKTASFKELLNNCRDNEKALTR
jgi:hypothetical protein